MSDIGGQPIQFPSRGEIIDQSNPNNTYIGKSKITGATSAPIWQIQQISNVAGVLTFTWANGNNSYTNIWDNRTSLSYS